MLGDQAAGGADAVQYGHVQVEQDGVGVMRGHLGQRLLTVGGRPDHLDAGQAAQQQDQALAHAGLVVGDDHAERGRGLGGHDASAGAGCSTSAGGTDGDDVGSGSPAATTQCPSWGPVTSVPFSSRRRSRIPVSP